MIIPSKEYKFSEYILETLSYSVFNYLIIYLLYRIFKVFPLNLIMVILDTMLPKHMYILISLFLLPCVWPIVLYRVAKLKLLTGKVLTPAIPAWDFFFKQHDGCYIIVHLIDNSIIAGSYSSKSYASRFPMEGDIYLEDVWELDEENKFKDIIEGSKGAWIPKNQIKSIEFLEMEMLEEGREDGDGCSAN